MSLTSLMVGLVLNLMSGPVMRMMITSSVMRRMETGGERRRLRTIMKTLLTIIAKSLRRIKLYSRISQESGKYYVEVGKYLYVSLCRI